MAATPASPPPDPQRPPTTLAEWLRARTDRQLATLLQLRPDLTLPAPADIASLAGRVTVRTSTQRAVDALDAFTLRTLENLVLAAGTDDTVVPDETAGLDELFDRALIWGDGTFVRIVATVREALGAYPAGLGRPAAALLRPVSEPQLAPVLKRAGIPPTAQPRAGAALAERIADEGWLSARLAERDDEERDVLRRLADGPPVGTVRDTRLAARETPDADVSPAHRLIRAGLLVPLDSQRVELPREVGQRVRRDAGAGLSADPPTMPTLERTPADLDRSGTTAVLETLRLVEALAETWTAHPPAVLRTGGLGVRDLRRTARDLGVDETAAAVVIETVHAAGLLNTTSGPEPTFLPSVDYDDWLARDTAQRWITIASAWLAMSRQPSLVGLRGDRDRVITALGPDAERGTVAALRRQVLEQLATLPPGAAPTDRQAVLDLFAWRQPRRAGGQRPVIEAILTEADLLGLTSAGGITGYTRTLVAGLGTAPSSRSHAAAEHALDIALPAPVDHFLVQPDLTVVVPGPPEADVGRELGLLADLESTGGASVYRITERSVRRALDAGRTARELAAFVTTRSRTPVPQALSYLIDDAARAHGTLRTGTAGAYLRSDDTALLARVVADRATATLGLRLLAPTVVVADAPVTTVLDVLREAGFAPAAEAPDGELITLGFDPPRAPSRPQARTAYTRTPTDTDSQRAELVRRLRSGDALAGRDPRVQSVAAQVPGVTSAATMEQLRRAVREARLVWLGVANRDGSTTAHTVQPISLAAGTVRGYERGHHGLAAYPVHRITAIRVLDEDEADAAEAPDALDDGPGA